MGLEDSGPQLGRIDPSSLIGRADPDIVSPRNTALLADAFRQGFVTTDDIMERVGERAQLKKKADVMSLQEFVSPDAIEARQNQLALANQKTKMGLELLPDEKDAVKIELEGRRLAAEVGLAGTTDVRSELQKLGYAAPTQANRYSEKAQTEDLRRGDVVRRWKSQMGNALGLLKAAGETKLVETTVGATKGVVPVAFFENRPVSQAEIASAKDFVNRYVHPSQWDSENQPGFGQPGQVTIAPATAKAATSAKPDVMSAAGQPPGTTAASAAPVVVEAQNQAIAKIYKGAKTPAELAQAAEVEKQINASRQSAGAQPIVSEPPPAPMIEEAPAEVVQPLTAAPAAPKPDIFPEGFIPTGEVTEKANKIPLGGVDRLTLGAQAADTAIRMDKALQNLLAKHPQAVGFITGRIGKWVNSPEWSADVAALTRETTAILAPVAKGTFNETGVLSDKDVARYEKILPALQQDPKVAQLLSKELMRTVSDNYARQVDFWGKAGYDSSGFDTTVAEMKAQTEAQIGTPSAPGTAGGATPAAVVTIRGGKYKRGPDGLMHPLK